MSGPVPLPSLDIQNEIASSAGARGRTGDLLSDFKSGSINTGGSQINNTIIIFMVIAGVLFFLTKVKK